MKRNVEHCESCYGPGYVYVASNAFMPNLVKVGRTGGSVLHRLRTLYTTGVPGRFVADGERFFAECHTGERRIHDALGKLGRRCPNREFYEVPRTLALETLEKLYVTQHQHVQSAVFEWQIEEAFEKFLVLKNFTAAEHTFDAINLLPGERRAALQLQLLFQALYQGAESYAIWLVSNKKVNPEIPVSNPKQATGIPHYNITAFEYSILLGLTKLEDYFVRHGCDLRNSVALSLVVDVLINGPSSFDSRMRCTAFAVKLIERGACVQWPITAGLFSEMRRKHKKHGDSNFDVFPRNSNLSCTEIARRLAPENIWLAEIYRAIVQRDL